MGGLDTSLIGNEKTRETAEKVAGLVEDNKRLNERVASLEEAVISLSCLVQPGKIDATVKANIRDRLDELKLVLIETPVFPEDSEPSEDEEDPEDEADGDAPSEESGEPSEEADEEGEGEDPEPAPEDDKDGAE